MTTVNGYNRISVRVLIVVFLCLFLSSFTDAVRFFGLNQVSAFGIAALILAICFTIILGISKALKNKNQGERSSNILIYCTFGAVSLIFVVLRLLAFAGIVGYTEDLGNIAMRAMISENQRLYLNFDSLDDIFSTLLSVSFKMFGNTYFALYFLQFLMMGIAFAILCLVLSKIASPLSAALAGAGVALSPFCINSLCYGNSYNLFLILFSVSLLVIKVYADEIRTKTRNYVKLAIIGAIIGILYLNSDALLAILILPVLITLIESNDYLTEKMKTTGVYLAGAAISILLILVADGIFSGKGIAKSIDNVFANRFKIQVALGSVNYDIIWYIALILSITYIVRMINKKNDKLYIFTYVIIISGLQSILLGANNNGALYLVQLIGLLAVSGMGLKLMTVSDKGDGSMGYDADLKIEENSNTFFEEIKPEIVTEESNVIGAWDEITSVDKKDKLTNEVEEYNFAQLVENENEPAAVDDDSEEKDVIAEALMALEAINGGNSSEGNFEFAEEEVAVSNEPDYVENIDATNEAEPEYVDEHIDESDDKPEYEWDDETGEFVQLKSRNEADVDGEVISSQETFFDDDAETVEEPVAETAEEPIDYIENPLPLPKKHVHREMDYGRIVPQALMHYDYEVTPDKNHYDI